LLACTAIFLQASGHNEILPNREPLASLPYQLGEWTGTDVAIALPLIAGGVTLVFLDGWKKLYLPVLKLLEPALAPGALVAADDLDPGCRVGLRRVVQWRFQQPRLR